MAFGRVGTVFRLRAWAGLLVLALLALAASLRPASAWTWGDPAPCQHFHLTDQTAIIPRAKPSSNAVPPQGICVPTGYLITPFAPLSNFKKLPNEHDITGLAISAKYPTMETIWEHPTPRKQYDPLTHGNRVGIWFGMETGWTSVDFRFHVAERLDNASLPAPPQFGLEHRVPDPSDRAWKPKAELYFKREEPHTMFIRCGVAPDPPSPGCTEEFTFNGYLIRTSYSVVYLPIWEEMQKKTEQLIKSFYEVK